LRRSPFWICRWRPVTRRHRLMAATLAGGRFGRRAGGKSQQSVDSAGNPLHHTGIAGTARSVGRVRRQNPQGCAAPRRSPIRPRRCRSHLAYTRSPQTPIVGRHRLRAHLSPSRRHLRSRQPGLR
jgi:hypothetical protein